MDSSHFIISEEDWSIHRKGYENQQRYHEKIKKALKQKLPELVSKADIIVKKEKESLLIPVWSLNEYKIRYDRKRNNNIGQGQGDSKKGDIIAKDKTMQQQDKQGHATENLFQQNYYEVKISIAELEELFFEELALPNLKQKKEDKVSTEDMTFHAVHKKGLEGNMDKKRTMLEAYRRNARYGNPSFFPIYVDDVRYKTWNVANHPTTKAVVLAIMDTSGSMDDFKSNIARSFFFWVNRFLNTNYESVELEFIAHHIEASVVDEISFFTKGKGGGTICSSAYKKALELINKNYHPDNYNIYIFHVSDGANLASDNCRCEKLIKELLEYCSLFGYVEVNTKNRHSSLMKIFKERRELNLRSYTVKNESDVYYAMKQFFAIEQYRM
ncbi:YeaH/YhbH family protein [Paraliobacillus salinarum]|uniref:YeaH/YhbH family protein n=1 Tax=Paraliobacillus salinarum TaxID=1158996 RepID=UPI0015F6B617|nr:DUF444 family protein [Paraliobacillus salinarum]